MDAIEQEADGARDPDGARNPEDGRDREADEDGFEFGGEERQVVEFRLGADVCAIDIETVDTIVELTRVTRIPRTPPAVDGVMDLRGETTAIIDPKEFLGIEGERTDDQKILVLDRADDKQKIGIRVDEVLEVATYWDGQIDRAEEITNLETRGIERRISKGLIRKPIEDEVDLVVWLDVDAMVDAIR